MYRRPLGTVPGNKGKETAAEPIRLQKHVEGIRIKLHKLGLVKDLAVFDVGTKTALRCSDLLNLRLGDLQLDGDRYRVGKKEQKTQKKRTVLICGAAFESLNNWLKLHPNPTDPEDYVFRGERGKHTKQWLNNKVKEWTSWMRLTKGMSTHTLRKTWAYHAWKYQGAPLTLIQLALNHGSAATTLAYLGELDQDVEQLYTGA